MIEFSNDKLPSRYGATAGLKKNEKNIAAMLPHFLAHSYWKAEGALYFNLPD